MGKTAENKVTKLFKNFNLRSYTMIFALIIIAIFFQIITNGTFLNPRNFSILVRQMSITGIITVGMALLIISGNFDLSVGSVVALTGGIAAVLQVWLGWSTPMAIIMAILTGIIIGSWQGFWVAYKKVPSFIVTLAGMMMFRGIYLVMTDGITVTPLKEDFTNLSQGFISPTIGIILGVFGVVFLIVLSIRQRISREKYGFSVPSIANMIARILFGSVIIGLFIFMVNSYLGLPIPVLILLILVLIFIFISNKTSFGRAIYAIGGNVETAKLSGINVELNIMMLFIVMGVLASISGILLTARLDGATASAGQMFEMDAIAACVIGGISLSGGKGSIFGAIIGALIMASLDNGMSLMNLSSYYQYIVKGLVLILAVWFDVSSKRNT